MSISSKNIYRTSLIIGFVVVFFAYHYSNILNYFQSNGTIYRVQIAASLNKRIEKDTVASYYKLTEEVKEDSSNGWYKYSVGNFNSYQEASKYKDFLVERNNIKGAFVVLFKDNTKVSKTIISHTPVVKYKYTKRQVKPFQKTFVSHNYTYRVQVGASKINISLDSLRNILNINENINVEVGEWYRYIIGNFSTYTDAKQYCDKLSNINGKRIGFIVAYLNNQRTSSIITTQNIAPVKYKKAINNHVGKVQIKTQKKYIPPKVTKTIIAPRYRERYYPVVKKDLVIYHSNTDELSNVTKNILKQPEIIVKESKPVTTAEIYNSRKDVYVRPGNTVSVLPSDTMKYKRFHDQNIKKKSYFNQIIDNGLKTVLGIVVLLLIIYLVFNFILVTVIVFVSRIRKNRKDRRIKKLEEEIQNLLAEYLFNPDMEISALNQMKNISSSFKRNILIQEIMRLSLDMSGEALENLRTLFFSASLDKDSLRKLRDRRWHIKVKGCRELTRMKAFKSKDEIEKMLNSKNEIVRMEAQIAMIELNEDNPYYFLDKLTKPFLGWEHLNVQVLIQRNGYEVPDFNKWLRVSNETVVLFAIEMIRIYKQISNAPRLVNFFEHPNLKIRAEAIRAVGEVGYVDCLPDLRRIYNYSDEEFKSLILKTMQILPDDNNKDFLKNILEGRYHKRFKLDAAKAMAALGVRGQIELKKFAQSGDEELVSIVNHVFDKRI